jgi:quercetin dioxygenase-like cupin family protein
MTEPFQIQTRFVPHGGDRFSEKRGLGITTLAFKVASEDMENRLFVIEQTMHAKGGPPRHLHLAQDEWFYPLEGEFVAEVGEEHFQLTPGDSLLAPRNVPHVWAYVGDGTGRILIAFSPAGQMQAFFKETTKANAMPPQDPALWEAHGMQLLGPPMNA